MHVVILAAVIVGCVGWSFSLGAGIIEHDSDDAFHLVAILFCMLLFFLTVPAYLVGLVFRGVQATGVTSAVREGGTRAIDQARKSEAARMVGEGYRQVAASVVTATAASQAKARARRVVDQLREQLAAGAVDEAEFSERVQCVNEKLAQELNNEERMTNA